MDIAVYGTGLFETLKNNLLLVIQLKMFIHILSNSEDTKKGLYNRNNKRDNYKPSVVTPLLSTLYPRNLLGACFISN